MVASVIREDFDLHGAMKDLETILWNHLGVAQESSTQSHGVEVLATLSA